MYYNTVLMNIIIALHKRSKRTLLGGMMQKHYSL